jgi:hypothetical protein
MYRNNSRDSSKFKGCSPLQLLCNLIGNRPQSATFHTRNRYRQCDEKKSNLIIKSEKIYKEEIIR